MHSYELSCPHKKRSEIFGETRFVGLVARPVWRTFHGCQGHSGLGRVCNMKVCVGVSKLRLLEHILLLNSWPSRCPSCPSSPAPSLTQHFGSEGCVQKMKCRVFFSPFSYKLSKEKQVKLLKIDFQREHIFQLFGAFALRQVKLLKIDFQREHIFQVFGAFALRQFSKKL
jgi:hypothetical protein